MAFLTSLALQHPEVLARMQASANPKLRTLASVMAPLVSGVAGRASASAPPAPAGNASFDDQLRQMYRQYLGREATQQEIDGHRNNPGGLAGIFQQMQQDPSFRSYNPANATGGGAATTPYAAVAPSWATGIAPNTPAAIGATARQLASTFLGRSALPGWAQGLFAKPAQSTGAVWGLNPQSIQAGAVGSTATTPATQASYGAPSAESATTPPALAPTSYDDWMNARDRGW